MKIFVKPANENYIVYKNTAIRTRLKDSGESVDDAPYWRRRESAGDVVILKAAPKKDKPVKDKKESNKKEKLK